MEIEFIKDYLKIYLQKINPGLKIKDNKLFKCVCCGEPTAQVLSTLYSCYNPEHNFTGNIFDVFKKVKPEMSKLSDEDITDYLIHFLDINLEDNINVLLKKYYEAGFFLFPISSGTKVPVKDFKWKEDSVHSVEVWQGWLNRGYGLGLKLGIDSNVIAIDIDSDDTLAKIKHLFNDTLIQTTKRGHHFLYNYDKDFDHVNHDNMRDKGYEMEARCNNAYIVIAPTSVEGEKREWNKNKIADMGPELKAFLLENINKEAAKKDQNEKIQEAINNNDLGHVKLRGLDGQCNDTFIKIGGALRKQLNIEQTEYSLSLFNNLLADPMPSKQIKAMMRELNKYQTYDKEQLSKLILERFDIIKEGTAFQLSKTLSLAQKDIEDVLNYLEREGKIISIGNNRFKKLSEVKWSDNLTDESLPINFEMPYFGQYAFLNWQEIIILAAVSGSGKTVLSANIVKQLNTQNIVPYILSTESTSTLGKTFNKLGVQPGQYKYKVINNALEAELPDNAVVILDWLSVKDGEFAKISSMYAHLYAQVKKHNSFLIVFEQLKKDGTFFAQNLNLFYCSLAASYHYGQNNDYRNTHFKTHKIRDSKTNLSYITIPCEYNPDTREVKVRQ